MAVITRDPFVESEFEISPVISDLHGGITAEVFEEGGVSPTTIITTDQDWRVDVSWYIKGHLVRHLCGSWCLSVVLESVGPGEEYSLPHNGVEIPMDPCGDGRYTTSIKVPAGTVAAANSGTLYLLAVTLTSKDPCDKPGHIAAYAKGPNLMFYAGPPHS